MSFGRWRERGSATREGRSSWEQPPTFIDVDDRSAFADALEIHFAQANYLAEHHSKEFQLFLAAIRINAIHRIDDELTARSEPQLSPHFFEGPKCNLRLTLRCDDSRMTSPEARVRASNCREWGRAMLNVGP